MKTNLLSISVFIFLIAISNAFAASDDAVLPELSSPALLKEGTQRLLSQSQVDELLPWAKNSKLSLIELLEDIKDMTVNQKVIFLSNGIQSVVNESNPKSELLMRYVLNRAFVLIETLNKETEENKVGVSDSKLRILLSSIKMAINYYDLDSRMLNNQSKITFAAFGANYFHFLLELNKSIFDASAQFEIHKIILEWLAWDIYRDLNNKLYASQIVKINNFLSKLTTEKLNDKEALVLVRKMRDLEVKLKVSEISQNIINYSTGRELRMSERVLVVNKSNGLLRNAIVYANVSNQVPDSETNNSHYCLKFTEIYEGERFMSYENYVKRNAIYLASGCSGKFCVGEDVIEKKSQIKFKIIGLDVNGDYAVRSGNNEIIGLQEKDLIK